MLKKCTYANHHLWLHMVVLLSCPVLIECFGLRMDHPEDQPEAAVFIPRPLPQGPSRPGCLPIRLFMLMQLITGVPWFDETEVRSNVDDPCQENFRRTFHIPYRTNLQNASQAFILPPNEVAFRNVDAFSGRGAIARGFRGRGHRVARLDTALNEMDDPQINFQF